MRIYRSSLWLLLAGLIMLPELVEAEWVALEAQYQSHPLQTIYIDPSTLQRQGKLVTLSALIDWKWMQGNRSPTRFFSTKITKQFVCAGKLVRTLAATDFYGHMGTGEVIGGGVPASEGHWVAAELETVNQGLWEAACGKG